VLVFTADTAPDLPRQVEALGARGFLRKPLDPAALLEAVKPLLRLATPG
jgi:DNA-binding NarL/FixJ family response regulator